MIRILIILLLSSFTGNSQLIFGKLVPPPDTVAVPALIIFSGESNSGGAGLNSSATAAELLPRGGVRIFDNYTMVLDSLKIGDNNLIGHVGYECCFTTQHGWELQLANLVDSSTLPNPVYLVKTGAGGSRISQWAEGQAYWDTMQYRVDSSINLVQTATGKTPKLYLFYSQAINDISFPTPTATWKAATLAHFDKIRVKYGTVPIFMTNFPVMGANDWTTYNTAMNEIAAERTDIYVIDGDAANDASAHWTYAGLKIICSRMVTTLLTYYYSYIF